MTTKADVINEALVACDQPEATGPSDSASWVRRMNNRYAATVRELLEKHPWNFAMVREQLQVIGDATPIGRDYAYTKPGACLRIVLINDSGEFNDIDHPDIYEDEGGVILSDTSPLYIFYTSSAWAVNEGAWPQVFASAVSLALAAKCYGLFGKAASKKDELKKDARKALQDAKSWDAAQKPTRTLPRGRWASSRQGYRYPGSGSGTGT